MKNMDKKALEQAFSIPEPERKDEFLDKYGSQFQRSIPKPFAYKLTRFAAAAAVFAAVFFAWHNLGDVGKLRHDPGNNTVDNIPFSTSSTEFSTSLGTTALKTTSLSGNTSTTISTRTTAVSGGTTATSAVTEFSTEFTTVLKTTDISTSETVISTEIDIIPHEFSTSQSTVLKTTEKPPATATTAVHTSHTSVLKTTSSQETTTTAAAQTVPVEELPESASREVVPETVYQKYDKVVSMEELVNKETTAAPGSDTISPAEGGVPELLISGEVLENYYTVEDGIVLTYQTVQVTYVIMGSAVQEGDIITVVSEGGYVPIDVAEEILEISTNITGDVSVYFPGVADESDIGSEKNFNLHEEDRYFIIVP